MERPEKKARYSKARQAPKPNSSKVDSNLYEKVYFTPGLKVHPKLPGECEDSNFDRQLVVVLIGKDFFEDFRHLDLENVERVLRENPTLERFWITKKSAPNLVYQSTVRSFLAHKFQLDTLREGRRQMWPIAESLTESAHWWKIAAGPIRRNT